MATLNNKNTYYLGNENLPTKNTQLEASPEQVKHFASEMQKCRNNLLYFAENYFYIINPDEGRVKIQLRKYQKRFLRKIRDNRFMIFNTSRQIGKALALDTPILTPNGWTTQGELKVGDKIYDTNGKLCNVTYLHPIEYNRPCYEVIFDNGEKIIADEQHEWFTQTKNERHCKKNGSIKTTKEILKQLTIGKKNEPFHRIPKCNSIEGVNQNLDIDPYLLGYWLGDGTSCEASFTIGEQFIDEFEQHLQTLGENYSYNKQIIRKNYNSGLITYKIYCKSSRNENSLIYKLKKYNLINNKHIPVEYLLSSKQQRLELLSGLIDSDGWVTKNGVVQFCTINETIKNNVVELLHGLGYKPHVKLKQSKYNDKICNPHYRITFIPNDKICKLSFKRNRIRVASKMHRSQYHYIKNIIPVKSVPVRCITVDSPDHMYLAGKHLIPTHNSTLLTIYALWYVLNNPDKNVLLLANKEDTAIEIFGRIKLAYMELPNWLKPGVEKWDQTKMILTNGSRITVSTTTESAARGFTINLLLLDEFAFVDFNLAENFFKSVFPTVSASKTAKIVITSTPNGDGNIFYRLYQGALNHENGWACDSVIWSDVPGRDEKWKQETMKTMGSAEAFAQEFEAVFISSKSTFVNEELVQTLKHKIKDPLYIFEDGKYKIWEEPNENNIYVAGIDTSEGIGRDSSEINILDITNLQDIRQVATYSNNNIQPYDYASKVYEILQQWGSPLALIERNNQGGIVIDNLINRYGYENIVSWGASLANRKNVQQGIISHTNVRNKAVGIMRYLLTEAQVVTINNLDTIEEFRNFVRYPNGVWAAKKGENYHDDKVLSLIWSLFILNDDIISTYFEVKGRDKNGIPNKIEKFTNGINYFNKNESTLELQQYNTQNYSNDIFLIGGVNNNLPSNDWSWLSTYGE